jgi:hypothetical protein
LVLHQQQSTWGKLLLRDVPARQVPQELLKLDAAAQCIEARQGRGLYASVQQVPQAAAVAAARAAQAALAAAGPGSSLFDTRLQHWQQQQQQQLDAQHSSQASAAADGEAARVTALSPAAAVTSAGGSAAAMAAAAAAADHELEPKEAARHMVDDKQLGWFGQQASSRITGEASSSLKTYCNPSPSSGQLTHHR